jgi:hypothetical protein
MNEPHLGKGSASSKEEPSRKNFQKGKFSESAKKAKAAFLEFRKTQKGQIGGPRTPLQKKMQSSRG